jgi:hypothetical protein
MPTGMQLTLTQSTIALDVIDGKRIIVTIPREAILTVLPGFADGEKMVSVLWGSRVVVMFEIDLAMRGTEIRSRSAAA